MKAIICELCGSNDLVKNEGFFVCQHCGTKYTVEEARKLFVDGPVDVSGSTVKIDNSESINKFLDLAKSELEAGSGESALAFADKALEVNPKSAEAWNIKMRSYEAIATLGDSKRMETRVARLNVITYAEDTKKAEHDVYEYFLTRGFDLIQLSTYEMSDTSDISSTYKQMNKVDAIGFLISPLSVVTNAFLGTDAGSMASETDKGTVEIYQKVAEEGINFTAMVPDAILSEYYDLCILLYRCAEQYEFETIATINRFKSYGQELSKSEINSREYTVNSLKEKANSSIKKAIKAKPEVKDEIISKKEKIAVKINLLETKLRNGEYEWPKEVKKEYDLWQKEIFELENKKGLFSNKSSELKKAREIVRYLETEGKKKDINAEIGALKKELEYLKSFI